VTGAPKTYSYKASGKNNTEQLAAALTPDNATDKTVKWASDKTAIATVDANGLVTFKGAEGDVKITVTAGDVTGTATIKVSKNVTAIRTPLSKVYIQKGKSLTIPVVQDDSTNSKVAVSSKLTWKSSKTSVARVDSKGKVTARKAGTAKITVKAANGKSKTITVVVASKATKLKKVTAKFPKSLKVGKAYQLKLKLTSAKATGVKVTFKSSKASVLKVDKSGKLLALKKGKATITIKAGSKTYKKTVTVK
jgi:alpha-L-fucosidase 2